MPQKNARACAHCSTPNEHVVMTSSRAAIAPEAAVIAARHHETPTNRLGTNFEPRRGRASRGHTTRSRSRPPATNNTSCVMRYHQTRTRAHPGPQRSSVGRMRTRGLCGRTQGLTQAEATLEVQISLHTKPGSVASHVTRVVGSCGTGDPEFAARASPARRGPAQRAHAPARAADQAARRR